MFQCCYPCRQPSLKFWLLYFSSLQQSYDPIIHTVLPYNNIHLFSRFIRCLFWFIIFIINWITLIIDITKHKRNWWMNNKWIFYRETNYQECGPDTSSVHRQYDLSVDFVSLTDIIFYWNFDYSTIYPRQNSRWKETMVVLLNLVTNSTVLNTRNK